ncbi:hypothetical protein [Sphingomonas sp. MS122]|uniref:hypothetical protein n=1 Tax=Sphingomonas sp. MS122 TaxID=3412683 RepID=UPI003C2C0924
MNDVALILFLLVTGPGFLMLGIWNFRTRAWRDGVPAIELMIDRAAGVELPARNATDRRFGFFNALMLVLFGAFFSLVLVAVLYSQFVPE